MRISDWSSDVCSSDLLVGAVARVAVTPGTRDAEFAILVSRYVAGMGLGRHLMRRLVRWARGKKLERMYGDVLESNQPMLSLADSLGFRREASDTPGLVRVVLDLATRSEEHTSELQSLMRNSSA